MKLIIGFNVLFFLLLPLLSMCTTSIKEKVCQGNVHVNSGNIHSFKDCTQIKGFLLINENTFTGDIVLGLQKMDPSELEVFSTLREVRHLFIDGASHPNFTDLHYFANLETIRTVSGQDNVGGLYISYTSLKSLGLRSLRTLNRVTIIYNKYLCFADGINWQKFTTKYAILHHVEYNRPINECVDEDMVCHEMCTDDGCWGPGVDECLQCKGFSLEGKCVDSCYYPGLYQSGYNTCGKCHEQCKETCTGPNSWKCVKCIKDGPYCAPICPFMTYKMNDDCLPCNEKCANGCTGPGNFVGFGGCDTCHNATVYSDNPNEITRIMCQKANEPCEEGYYSELIRVTNSFDDLKSMAGKLISLRCHPSCKRCLRCSSECKECWGPGWNQCKTCLMLKVPLGDNITHEFNCSDKCPDDKPHILHNHNGPYCSAFKPAENGNINVPAIVGGVLGCTLLIGIFVTVVVYQCWPRANRPINRQTIIPLVCSVHTDVFKVGKDSESQKNPSCEHESDHECNTDSV